MSKFGLARYRCEGKVEEKIAGPDEAPLPNPVAPVVLNEKPAEVIKPAASGKSAVKESKSNGS